MDLVAGGDMHKASPEVWAGLTPPHKSLGLGFYCCRLMEERTLFDSCFLTYLFAQIEQACSVYFTEFSDFDLVDEWRVHRKDTFHTYTITDLANSKGTVDAVSTYLHNISTVILKTFFVTFLDLIGYNDVVPCSESGKLLGLSLHLLLYKLDRVHGVGRCDVTLSLKCGCKDKSF